MNTPAHLLLGAALFGSKEPGRYKLTLGALLGGLLPDLSLYIMSAFAIVILQTPAEVVFGELYFSDSWQFVFRIDNSFVLWAALLGVAIKLGNGFFIALTAAAVLHLGCDFTLHNDDARVHFWPISDWRFISPLSYWDSTHHAGIVAPIEGLLCGAATAYLLIKKIPVWLKLCFVSLLVAEIFVIRSWLLFF